jgi:membrane-bound lytic murein transglycosylase D
MSMLTMRRMIARRKTAIVKGAASTVLFTTAAFVVASTNGHPADAVVRPAALALTSPVVASSRPTLNYLSNTPLARPAAAPIATAATAAASNAKPSWELANISNPRVDKWVAKFTTSLKNDFGAAMRRGREYSMMISRKLDARDMPQELIYLPMIESEFKPTARSRVSAVGLWQFMASTARHFGLTVAHRADDRTNPSKSTDAALAYLSQLHDRFGSWYLAAAAYNAGPGTVSRALRKVTGRTSGTDADFYRIAPKLPAETRDYVPKLVAAARVGKAAGDLAGAHLRPSRTSTLTH